MGCSNDIRTLGELNHEIPVVHFAQITYDPRDVTPDIDGAFLSDSRLVKSVGQLARAGSLPILEGSTRMRVGAPIARPSAIICVGMNYAAHAHESGSEPPTTPIIFLKTPNTIVGPDDNLRIPPGSTKTDWEVEFGLVIGSRAAYLQTLGDAARCVAGFVAADDVSERAHQIEQSGGQWSKGKSSPRFLPLGPHLVTPDELDHHSLRLRSWVNGSPRQDSSTADMIFSVEYLIWHLSHYIVLEPGNVVLTGTPQGVALSGRFPYLREGDVVLGVSRGDDAGVTPGDDGF